MNEIRGMSLVENYGLYRKIVFFWGDLNYSVIVIMKYISKFGSILEWFIMPYKGHQADPALCIS